MDEIDYMKNFVIWMKLILYFFATLIHLLLWMNYDHTRMKLHIELNIFLWSKDHSFERDNMINGVDLMDDDMMDKGDHHPYKLNFMLDSICRIKFITIKFKSMCLINFIHVKFVPIHPNSFPSLWFEV